MSLETKIEALTAAVVALTAAVANRGVPQAAPTVAAPVEAPAPIVPQSAPVAAAPMAMPPPPSFTPPMPPPVVAAPVAAPVQGPLFTDVKGLIQYTMETYRTLGPAKGGQIQNVLKSLGVDNINSVKPEQFAAFYAGVEALKA